MFLMCEVASSSFLNSPLAPMQIGAGNDGLSLDVILFVFDL